MRCRQVNYFNCRRKKPFKSLGKIFRAIDLSDLYNNLHYWKELAVCNDNSYYHNNINRENLLLFCNELYKVLEVLYIIYKKHNFHNNTIIQETISPDTIMADSPLNNIICLNDLEIKHPHNILIHFFGHYSYRYAKAELLDLLEAVISYEGNRTVDKLHLITFYQCLKNSLKTAWIFYKNQVNTNNY